MVVKPPLQFLFPMHWLDKNVCDPTNVQCPVSQQRIITKSDIWVMRKYTLITNVLCGWVCKIYNEAVLFPIKTICQHGNLIQRVDCFLCGLICSSIGHVFRVTITIHESVRKLEKCLEPLCLQLMFLREHYFVVLPNFTCLQNSIETQRNRTMTPSYKQMYIVNLFISHSDTYNY